MVSGGVSNILWGVGMNIIGLYKFRDNAQLETIVFFTIKLLGGSCDFFPDRSQ